jgi:glutamate/tyrosine decarboxylase-like PLP-dependent enzyme
MIPEEYVRRLPQLLKQLAEKMPSSIGGETAVQPGYSVWPDRAEAGNTGGPEPAGPETDGVANAYHPDPQHLDEMLRTLVDRLSRHYPFHQPYYAGQMLKPPHPAAWLAYALAMTINPNNHALDGGPEASHMEKEVVRRLAGMVGFPEETLGHLTSSGTIANLEALWVARELHPDRPIAVSSQAHYTHKRMGEVLRHPVVILPVDGDGHPDPSRLEPGAELPGTVVVTMGTTGLGRVEPLHRILPWARENGVRVHVDAAYGGFFHLLRESGLLDREPWEVLSQVDSMVIDPHKHGLQPYGCGTVLFRDPSVGKLYRHDSPYTYFTSDELHLGEISLECSRAGAAAVALWFTLQLLMPDDPAGSGRGGTGAPDLFTGILADCRKAALRFHDELVRSDLFRPVMKPELDIVTWVPVTRDPTFSAVNSASNSILKLGMDTAAGVDRLYLSTLTLSREDAARWLPDLTPDTEHVNVLRSVLMKPGHLDAVPDLMRRLGKLHALSQTR